MPPRKRAASAPPPMTDADVAALKPRVQAGDKPRVVVRTASAAVPAGTRGNIVRVGNPSEGEYVVVRLGKDEVPFAPGELSMSGRSAKALATAAATPNGAAATPARKTTTKQPAAKQAAAKQTAPRQAPRKQPAAKQAPAEQVPAKQARTKRPARAARHATRGSSRRSLPPLVVTLRFTDGAWTVEAARGARRLAKASPVRPGAVKAFADLVDDATVRDAVVDTIDSCRSVVEERAAALRAELDAAEAALKEYEARRR